MKSVLREILPSAGGDTGEKKDLLVRPGIMEKLLRVLTGTSKRDANYQQ